MDEMYHHGILGQKWGVRRFQNKDGSLTAAGKKRRNDVSDKALIEYRKRKIQEAPSAKDSPHGANKGWWQNAPKDVIKRHYLQDKKNELGTKDVVLAKNTEIHRIVPKSWVGNEINYSGHAYASFDKEDVEHYRNISRLFGANNYVDMKFKAKDALVSPSQKKRVEEFIKLMDSNPTAKETMLKGTRTPLLFMPKKYLDKLNDPKIAKKAYDKFSFLLVSKRELRDPYFESLKKQGYSMVLDDADIKGKISKSPIIVFDRKKSLSLEDVKLLSDISSDDK